MKILVLNCGSSSIKYSLFETDGNKVLAEGRIEKIGEEYSIFIHETSGTSLKKKMKIKDHRAGLEVMLKALTDSEIGVINDLSEISAVGHRVVHGGSEFVKSTIIDDEVLEAIRKYSCLAPLHNPSNLLGIEILMDLLPDVPHVAVFDTAFHQTIPRVAHVYPIPYRYYREFGIRRYGFHGTSHRYVSRKAAEILGRDVRELKIITCHLGNGCSITAVDGGKSVDTSMGFTPLEGVPMGTRSGDIDPSIIQFLIEKEKLTVREVFDILNRRSGLLGVSEISNDLREVKEAADKGDEKAKLAIEILSYRVKKYIGAYAAVMGGVNVIVFTGGIGENAHYIRSAVCRGLQFLGVNIDNERNMEPMKHNGIISSDDSKVKVLVIPTREDMIIASEVLEAVNPKKK
ncbi:acetate kinase [Candidatus Bathyarchaeota archaeon]|nr:MAG: acetate kinase [Candidatus Bathyarchaeota archaeon]